jgi:deazaflavin-dependent oxidoreductase (nitroreductase family)
MPVLLLTTTGRRSGKARSTPLTFFRDGTDLVVIASNGGADRPPDWSLNLQHTPRAVVEIGTDKLVASARPASEQERERLRVVITATYTGYARYQERTERRIPVVPLTPEGPQVLGGYDARPDTDSGNLCDMPHRTRMSVRPSPPNDKIFDLA